MNKLAATGYLVVLTLGGGTLLAEARPEYARNTSKPCGYCHTRAAGGGQRNFRGMFYGANSLSFEKFDEKREALIAAVAAQSEGPESNPPLRYIPNVSGPATQQIQLASLRGPVVLVFLAESKDEVKKPLEILGQLSKAYGNKVAFIGVLKGDTDAALKLTDKLESRVRILPDPDGAAIKKFGAKNIWDLALVAKQGDPVKTFEGFSRANVESLIKLLEESQEVPAPQFEIAKIDERPVLGTKLPG